MPRPTPYSGTSPNFVCAAVLAALLPAPPATAQITRLANDEPEIRVNDRSIGGRVGVCDVLAFTPDGKTLLAVGEDKVVHRWAVGPAGLEAQRPLYWNTFREQRGSIYALAVSAGTGPTRVAIGGYGKLNPDVAVFDLASDTLLGTLSPLSADTKAAYAAAREAVWALAFHPGGNELAIGDGAGNVWVCPLAAGKPVAARVARVVANTGPLTAGSRVVWVGYLPDGRLAYARRDGGVYVAGRAEPLFRWGSGAVDKVVASGDGRWLAARPTGLGRNNEFQVEIQSLPDGKRGQTLRFPRGRFPDRIALDRSGGRIAVGLSLYPVADGKSLKPPFAYELPGRVEVYALGSGPELVASYPSPDGPRVDMARPDQIAFHPDGKRLATADALDHGTSLWTVNGNRLTPVARDRGLGRALWGAGMTRDGRYLCFTDRRNPAPAHPNQVGSRKPADWTAFDLTADPRGWAAGQKEPVPPEDSRAGWTVRFEPKDEYVWYAVEPGGRAHELPLDHLRDDKPRCYTFLPPGPGARPGSVRLAVGHAWGVSVFDLAPGQDPKRVRRFAGHAGYVTAVAPAYGGQGLVSCGRDQVVAIWNLADYPAQPLLGAAFAEQNGKVVVTAVDPGSPADEAGLSVGAVVHRLMVKGEPKDVARTEWLRHLRNPQPASELALWVTDPKHPTPTPTKTSVLHRPIARFLPLRDGEWVLYTYRQCYYDCSPNGDRYVSWLVSKMPGANESPEVFPIDRFRQFLHKPDKVTDVVTRVAREPGKPLLPDLFPPRVSVQLGADRVKDGQDLKVTVTVVPQARQDGKVNKVERVELWLNGHHRVGTDLLAGKNFQVNVPFDVTFTVPAASLQADANRLHAVGIGADDPGVGAGAGRSAPAVVVLETTRPTRRLFGVAAGINDYGGKFDLDCAVPDAARMRTVWNGLQGDRGFAPAPAGAGGVVLLTNESVTRARLIEEIGKVGKAAGPDDVFVLFLAGHGIRGTDTGKLDLRGKGGSDVWFYSIPNVRENERLKAEDFFDNPARVQQAFLRDRDLFDALAALKCQPIVLLDCCHSGAAAQFAAAKRGVSARNAASEFRRYGFGPVVISACDGNQTAGEFEGHGFFTRHVADVLGGEFGPADADRDGKLSVAELFRAVRAGIPRYIAKNNLVDRLGQPLVQTPQIVPALDEVADLVIATTPAGGGAPKK